MKVTERVGAPALGTTPAAGVYTKLPGTEAVAFSWVAESAVPYVIAEGGAHVTTGVALLTVSCTVLLTVVKLVVSVGVKVTERVSVPAAGTLPSAGVYAKE